MRHLSLSLILVFSALLVCTVSAEAAYTWEQTAFSETAIQSEMGRLIPHPTDPGTLFLATVNMPAILGGTLDPADGLWMTADLGQTWTTINDSVLLTTYNILDIAICQTNPDVMYVATIEEGIFKSTDGGQSWSDVSGSFQYGGETFPNTKWGVMAVAVDPTDADRVYISVAQIGELDVLNLAPSHPGFFYSTDGGATWLENNSGLPPRYDDLWDGKSHTAAAGSIVVLPQKPNLVILGMADLEVNTAFLFNKTAETRGRVFASNTSGEGTFFEVSGGLPVQVKQSPEISGSLARVSSSTMLLSNTTGSRLGVWGSHVGLTFDVSLDATLNVTRNKGLFFTPNGYWQERNSGLPHVANWTDNSSTTNSTIKFVDTYNMGNVAVGKGEWDNICLSGSNRCDMGDATTNNTKVYATANSGLPAWLKSWDTGLDSSPTYGYTEANATMITFNADMSYGFATVRWSDDDQTSLFKDDNGVYRFRVW